jgi:hypothetical protein
VKRRSGSGLLQQFSKVQGLTTADRDSALGISGLRWIQMLAGFPFVHRLIVDVHVGLWQEAGKTIVNTQLSR